MATTKYEEGKYYAVEVPVQSTKRYRGRLMKIVKGQDGDILMFQGRTPFAAEASEIVSISEADEPSTGIRPAAG